MKTVIFDEEDCVLYLTINDKPIAWTADDAPERIAAFVCAHTHLFDPGVDRVLYLSEQMTSANVRIAYGDWDEDEADLVWTDKEWTA